MFNHTSDYTLLMVLILSKWKGKCSIVKFIVLKMACDFKYCMRFEQANLNYNILRAIWTDAFKKTWPAAIRTFFFSFSRAIRMIRYYGTK